MNNVNDLQHQPNNGTGIGPKGDNHSVVREPRQKSQPISLSYLKEGDTTQSVHIDATNISRQQQPAQQQEEFHINNMPRRKQPVRRSMQDDSRTIVNPSDIVQTKDESAAKPTDKVLSESFSALDSAVKRKKQEFHNFVDRALEADKVNRERIENGVEEAPTDEILYRLSDIDPERAPKEDIPTRKVSDGTITQSGEYIDDVEKDLEDELDNDYYYTGDNYQDDDVKTNVVIGQNANDYYNDDEDEDYDEDSITGDNDVAESAININQVNQNVTEDDDYKFDDIEIKDSSDNIDDSVEEETVVEDDHESDKAADAIIGNGFKVIQSDPEIKNIFKDVKPLDSNSVDVDEKDFDDIDLEEDSLDNDTSTEKAAVDSMSEEERIELIRKSREHLRSEVLEKIVEAGKKYNTSSIRVSNKVVSIKDALAANKKKEVQRGKFALMRAGRPIVFSAFSGLEIATLANESQRIQEGAAGYEYYGVGISPRMAEILYKHDMNPNKPASVKSWTKTIPALDADNLFGAVYLASLSGSNFMPRVCENPTCRYSFLEELNDINSFIKFGNKVSEERYNKIIRMPDYDGDSSSYETVVQIINDRYAIGIRDIPLHFFVYELPSLNAEFIDKYSTIINIVALIDCMYLITTDENGNAQLNKIGYKQYPMDEAKTLKSKVIAYAKIFQEFSDTDFAVLNAYMQIMASDIDSRSDINWSVPESKCPKCGRTIPAINNFAASSLVFTKQRLVESVITPTER